MLEQFTYLKMMSNKTNSARPLRGYWHKATVKSLPAERTLTKANIDEKLRVTSARVWEPHTHHLDGARRASQYYSMAASWRRHLKKTVGISLRVDLWIQLDSFFWNNNTVFQVVSLLVAEAVVIVVLGSYQRRSRPYSVLCLCCTLQTSSPELHTFTLVRSKSVLFYIGLTPCVCCLFTCKFTSVFTLVQSYM